MTQSKSEWRRGLLAARAAIPEAARRAASEVIVERLQGLAGFQEARTVLGYRAFGSEVRLDAVFAKGLLGNGSAFVPSPVLAGGDAPLWLPLSAGPRAEAAGVEARALTFPVVAIVPGVGFDTTGTRLGRGGGFYDRALAALRSAGQVMAIGLAYEVQIVEALPRDAWDQDVDLVVSEDRVLLPRPVRDLVRGAR